MKRFHTSGQGARCPMSTHWLPSYTKHSQKQLELGAEETFSRPYIDQSEVEKHLELQKLNKRNEIAAGALFKRR